MRLWEVTRADARSKAASLGKFAARRKRQLYSCQQTVQQSPREMGFVSAPVPTELGHTSLQSKKAESVKKKHTEAQARPNPSTPYTYPSAPASPASDAVFFGWLRTPVKSVVKTLRVQKKYRLYCRCCFCQKGKPVLMRRGRIINGPQGYKESTVSKRNSKLNEADIVLSINRALYRRT